MLHNSPDIYTATGHVLQHTALAHRYPVLRLITDTQGVPYGKFALRLNQIFGDQFRHLCQHSHTVNNQGLLNLSCTSTQLGNPTAP